MCCSLLFIDKFNTVAKPTQCTARSTVVSAMQKQPKQAMNNQGMRGRGRKDERPKGSLHCATRDVVDCSCLVSTILLPLRRNCRSVANRIESYFWPFCRRWTTNQRSGLFIPMYLRKDVSSISVLICNGNGTIMEHHNGTEERQRNGGN